MEKGNDFEEKFKLFTNGKPEMDGRSFNKMMKNSKLVGKFN